MRGANREGIRGQITAHAAAAASSGSSGAAGHQAAARAPGQMTKDLMAALQVTTPSHNPPELRAFPLSSESPCVSRKGVVADLWTFFSAMGPLGPQVQLQLRRVLHRDADPGHLCLQCPRPPW